MRDGNGHRTVPLSGYPSARETFGSGRAAHRGTRGHRAHAGLDVQLFLPETTPAPFIHEAKRLGATVQLVPGSIAEAGRIMRETLGPAGENGWFDMSTLREPFRVEGKKTMAYEIVEQLGFRLPDVIFYPTGGGTGIIGMWKAFDEMEQLGWIGSARPRMISVQATGCAPIVRAWEQGSSTAEAWGDPVTAASGLRVPKSLGDFLILASVRDSDGAAVAVSDEEMMQAVATAEILLGQEIYSDAYLKAYRQKAGGASA